MHLVLYTTHCPRCKVLEKKLQQKGLLYTENDNIDEMIEMGFKTAPLLSVDGAKPMDFGEAVKWIKEQGEVNGNN